MSIGNTIVLAVLAIFFLSATYVHYRGRERFSLKRQVTSHSTLMAPYNTFAYLFSGVPTTPYLDVKDFPELSVLQENWETIRDEALKLRAAERIKAADKYNDLAFNSFFRRGWTRFYLKWYDQYLPSAEEMCPKTVALLKSIPSINGALFAAMAPRSELNRHRDPFAGSLRYHLGLVTPNSEQCRIYVDGEPYHWKDGEAVLFDETYIHHAINDTDQERIILFCDVRRPMRNRITDAINRFAADHVVRASQTQNTETEKIGALNKLFGYLYHVRLAGKAVKQRNRTLYYALKAIVFGGVFVLLFWITR